MDDTRLKIQGHLTNARMHIDGSIELIDDALRSNLMRGSGFARDPQENEEGDPSPVTFALNDIGHAVKELDAARKLNASRTGAAVVRGAGVLAAARGETGPGSVVHAIEARDTVASQEECESVVDDVLLGAAAVVCSGEGTQARPREPRVLGSEGGATAPRRDPERPHRRTPDSRRTRGGRLPGCGGRPRRV